MGEYADLIINGEVCQQCMAPIYESGGFPTVCHECQDQGKNKREKNRIWSTNHLREQGIRFTAHNNGVHLKVKLTAGAVDFWPTTGKYKRPDGSFGRGIKNMLTELNKDPQ